MVDQLDIRHNRLGRLDFPIADIRIHQMFEVDIPVGMAEEDIHLQQMAEEDILAAMVEEDSPAGMVEGDILAGMVVAHKLPEEWHILLLLRVVENRRNHQLVEHSDMLCLK